MGEIIYNYITAEQFSPDCLLDCLDLSSEHHTLEIANRIEAAIHVWRLKGQRRHSQVKAKTASWKGKVKGFVADTERSQFLAERAEGLFQSLRIRFPGLPQTVVDMNKIQYNKVFISDHLESDDNNNYSHFGCFIHRFYREDDNVFVYSALQHSLNNKSQTLH